MSEKETKQSTGPKIKSVAKDVKEKITGSSESKVTMLQGEEVSAIVIGIGLNENVTGDQAPNSHRVSIKLANGEKAVVETNALLAGQLTVGKEGSFLKMETGGYVAKGQTHTSSTRASSAGSGDGAVKSRNSPPSDGMYHRAGRF